MVSQRNDVNHLAGVVAHVDRQRVLKTYKILGFISSGKLDRPRSGYSARTGLERLEPDLVYLGTYGRVYKAVLLPPPKSAKAVSILPSSTRAALSLSKDKTSPSDPPVFDPLHNPELCMRSGDLPAKEGEVFAIKKFKPDKEGDVQTYAGISQSGAREIMVRLNTGGNSFTT